MLEHRKKTANLRTRLLNQCGRQVLAHPTRPAVNSVMQRHELALTSVAGTRPAPRREKHAAEVRMRKRIRHETPHQATPVRQNL